VATDNGGLNGGRGSGEAGRGEARGERRELIHDITHARIRLCPCGAAACCGSLVAMVKWQRP
jgi:hypothetical protein